MVQLTPAQHPTTGIHNLLATMPRSGTLVICVQNLDFSGANQVVLNVVSGRVHQSNVVVLSPKIGTFAARFVDSGAAVRVGDLEDLLNEIRDVFCIICNTIMTAPIVVEMSNRVYPVVWILHEWWDDDMIVENLKMRNYENMTLDTVKQALVKASMIVFVCEAQRKLYAPTAPSSVIFVGVPDPLPRHIASTSTKSLIPASKSEVDLMTRDPEVFTFLCLGIICPRKNQLWTVQLFKEFAKDKPNARLKVVGARYTRVYEIEYLEEVRREIGDDSRIELLDVTDNVDPYYQVADALILTSLNEVTPMVISEAMSWSIPVLSTNIAGIGEMFTDGQEGFLFSPGDTQKALFGMESVYANKSLRQKMAVKARVRFETTFELDLMVDSYRQLMIKVAPPVILLDMDGVLVDWDKGFMEAWQDRCGVDRTRSYYMEDCILDPSYRKEALATFKAQGFFEQLPPMEGALQAIAEMAEEGLQLFICTSPVKGSLYCAQEKLNWVLKYLGEEWLDRVILCQDKTAVVGDLLVDDKPYNYLYPHGKHTAATWKQVVFDAPYNHNVTTPRLTSWTHWRSVLLPLLGKQLHTDPNMDVFGVDAGAFDAYSGTESLMPLNDVKLGVQSKGRTRATSDALLAGFQLPHMNLPHVTRPIGMLKLRRDTSNNSDTVSIHSLSHNKTPAELQRGVDMLQSSAECLSPEDIATILSGSMSLMNDNNGDDMCESSTHSHYTSSTGAGNTSASANANTGGSYATSTANNSTKGVSVVGDSSAGIAFQEDETAPSTAATTTPSTPIATHTTTTNPTTTTTDTTSPTRVPTNTTTSGTTTGTTTTTADTASTKERNEKIKSLNDAATKRQQDHKKEVDDAQRKQALESSAADSYRFWNRIPGFGGGGGGANNKPKN